MFLLDNPAIEIWASLATFKLKSLNLRFPLDWFPCVASNVKKYFPGVSYINSACQIPQYYICKICITRTSLYLCVHGVSRVVVDKRIWCHFHASSPLLKIFSILVTCVILIRDAFFPIWKQPEMSICPSIYLQKNILHFHTNCREIWTFAPFFGLLLLIWNMIIDLIL